MTTPAAERTLLDLSTNNLAGTLPAADGTSCYCNVGSYFPDISGSGFDFECRPCPPTVLCDFKGLKESDIELLPGYTRPNCVFLK